MKENVLHHYYWISCSGGYSWTNSWKFKINKILIFPSQVFKQNLIILMKNIIYSLTATKNFLLKK